MKTTIATVLAVVAAVAAGGTAAGHGAQHVSVELDWTPNPNHVGLFYAQTRGLFSANGLAVDLRPPSDPTSPLKLVATSATYLAVSYEQEIFFARNNGLPVVAVAAIVPRPLNSLIWLTPTIRSLADLRGHSIGITGVPSDYAMLDTLLHHAGLSRSDVRVVTVGYSLLPALLAHRVDAVLGVYPNVEGIELTLRHLQPHLISMAAAGVPSYDELVLAANSNRLHNDPNYATNVRRFIAALNQGTAAAIAHPNQAIKTLGHATQLTPSFLAAATPTTLRLLRQPGGVVCLHPPRWLRFGRWMQQQHLLNKLPAAVETTRELPASCTHS